MTYVLAIALGLVAGVLAGMFGVGGGLLFVPTLIVLFTGSKAAFETNEIDPTYTPFTPESENPWAR